MSARAFLFGLPLLAACSLPPLHPPRAGRAPSAPVTTPTVRADVEDTSYEVKNDGVVEAILRKHAPELALLLDKPEKYRFQVLFTEILDGKKTTLIRHGHRVDEEYIYPASAIKLPLAIAALEALHDVSAKSALAAYPETPWRVFDLQTGAPNELDASEPTSGKINLAYEIKKALIASDNVAYNRMYAFLGQRDANERLWKLGMTSARVRQRLGAGPENDDAKTTPAIEILVAPGSSIKIPQRTSTLTLFSTRMPGTEVGKAFVNAANERVERPLSFADKNRISLVHLQDALLKVMAPDIAPQPLPRLDDEDRAILEDALATLPSSSRTPPVEGGASADDLHKPLLRGIERVFARGRARIFSKGGRAYGFSVDNAYVVDEQTKRRFILTAALYTNDVGLVNGDRYEYEEIARPALASMGEAMARYAFR